MGCHLPLLVMLRERDCMPTTIIVIEMLAVFLAMQLNQRYLPFVDVGEFKT